MDATEPAGGVAVAPTRVAGPGVHRALGRYALLEKIGAGGFGTVWWARDERLDRDVAVKLVPEDRVGPRRRWREALAAARLSHPAIVQLYEADTDEHGAWLVSELVRGTPLAALLAEGALSDRDIAQIGVALADGLAHAHSHGVIHRDVKPANVLIPEAGRPGDAPAKLTDFGVALIADDDALTHTGDVVGTLAYMAPEQADGHKVTPAADLYALALVLHEAWAGTNPLRAATPAATARLVGTRLPALSRRRRDLPLELCEAIDRATDPDPARRGTLADLRRAIGRATPELSDEPGLVAPGRLELGIGPTASLPSRLLATVGAAGLAALGAFLAPGTPDVAPGPDRRRRRRARARAPARGLAGLRARRGGLDGGAGRHGRRPAHGHGGRSRAPPARPLARPVVLSGARAAARLGRSRRRVPGACRARTHRAAARGARRAGRLVVGAGRPGARRPSAGALVGHAARRDRRHGDRRGAVGGAGRARRLGGGRRGGPARRTLRVARRAPGRDPGLDRRTGRGPGAVLPA